MNLLPDGLKDKSAQSMLEGLRLSRRAKAIEAARLTPTVLLDTLREQNLLADAIQFYAQWLQLRELSWWTCLCVWHGCEQSLSDDEQVALKHAVRWIRRPNAASASAAEKAAKECGPGSAAGAAARTVALAAHATDDATEKAAGKMAAVAVLRAGGSEFHEDFLELARLVANGRHRWDAAAPVGAESMPARFEDWATTASDESVAAPGNGVGKSIQFRLGDTDDT